MPRRPGRNVEVVESRAEQEGPGGAGSSAAALARLAHWQGREDAGQRGGTTSASCRAVVERDTARVARRRGGCVLSADEACAASCGVPVAGGNTAAAGTVAMRGPGHSSGSLWWRPAVMAVQPAVAGGGVAVGLGDVTDTVGAVATVTARVARPRLAGAHWRGRGWRPARHGCAWLRPGPWPEAGCNTVAAGSGRGAARG